MAENNARRIADCILALARDRGIPISNLKLQKLLYYSQGWYLVFNNRPLFNDRIEAWVHGPVVARVFGEFKNYKWGAIDATNCEPLESSAIKAHISKVLDAYGSWEATRLERLTHKERPWIEARAGLAPDEPSQNEIRTPVMQEYFQSLWNAPR